METAFGASLTLPTGSNRGSPQKTPQKTAHNTKKTKKNWICVQFLNLQKPDPQSKDSPGRAFQGWTPQRDPPRVEESSKGGRFSIRKRLVLMTNTRGSLGPPKRCFFEKKFAFLLQQPSKGLFQSPNEAPDRILPLILFSGFQIRLWFSFEVHPGLILFRFFFTPFYF